MSEGIKPGKASKLIVEAIKYFKTKHGCTDKEIIDYIGANHGLTDQMVKCINTALRRGADDGVLQTNRNRFALKVVPNDQTVAKGNDSDACKKRRRPSCKRKRSRSRRRKCGGKRRSRPKKCGGKRHSRRRHRSRSRRRRAKCRC